jgi:hypothetical protein
MIPAFKLRTTRHPWLFTLRLTAVCCLCSLSTFPGGARGSIDISHKTTTSRFLNPHHKSRYYDFLNDDSRAKNTSLMDVWLCLACAMGWACWFVSSLRPPDRLVYETRESKKVWGNVLQVTLGEDNLGTGIPVYHAIVDFVVEGDIDDEPLQIRKVFSTKKLLEEGFANVEVLVLTEDPTTAILMEDFLELKKDQDKQERPSLTFLILTYLIAGILIGTSIVGSVLVILRMERPIFGWISLVITVVLIFPTAILLNNVISYICAMASLTERPGEIIHGERMYCTTKRCHGTIDPFTVFTDDEEKPNKTLELSTLHVPGRPSFVKHKEPLTPKKLFPNAGCGFGAFNVHLPHRRPRTGSSVSSMSASQNSNERNMVDKIGQKHPRILKKYEMHMERNG